MNAPKLESAGFGWVLESNEPQTLMSVARLFCGALRLTTIG